MLQPFAAYHHWLFPPNTNGISFRISWIKHRPIFIETCTFTSYFKKHAQIRGTFFTTTARQPQLPLIDILLSVVRCTKRLFTCGIPPTMSTMCGQMSGAKLVSARFHLSPAGFDLSGKAWVTLNRLHTDIGTLSAVSRHAPVVLKNKPRNTSSATARNTYRRSDWKEYDHWRSKQYPGWYALQMRFLYHCSATGVLRNIGVSRDHFRCVAKHLSFF